MRVMQEEFSVDRSGFFEGLRRSLKQLRVFSQNVVEIVELTLLLPLHFLKLWKSEVGRSIVVLVQIHFF